MSAYARPLLLRPGRKLVPGLDELVLPAFSHQPGAPVHFGPGWVSKDGTWWGEVRVENLDDGLPGT